MSAANEPSDFDIIRSVLAGNANDYALLVRRYQDRVFRLCVSMLGPASAEDAAQEVFLRVFQSLSRFRFESSFSTWLYRVTANHCLNYRRKNARFEHETLDAENALQRTDPKDNPEPAVHARLLLNHLLQQLSPDERVLLAMREIEGLTYDEIAEALELSLEAVKSRLFRARRALMAVAEKLKTGESETLWTSAMSKRLESNT